MPNPELDLIRNLVSERLKHVDGLVKAQKIEEAIKEITEIRKLDAKNPYALAYEERILALQQTLKTQPPLTPFNPALPTTEPKKEIPLPAREVDRSPAIPTSSAPVSAPHPQSYSIASGMPSARIQDSASQDPPNFITRLKGKASILLVDDDALLVQALAELLEDNRFGTTTYTRAEEALEYLKMNTPDLVICDVNLETSSFGGFTLHEKMRKFEHLRDVPFIFLSGLNDSAIVLAGKELGADDYLTKPVEPEALLAVVKGKLKRYRQIKKNL
jgi:CheY-like chemotaxis protein